MNSERIKNAVCQHSDTEMNMLRENIRANGVIDPIVLCRGTIIDGYARYSIATALGIPFKTVEIDFADEAEAIIWRVKTHIGRRNLTAYQKCEMVLPLEAELRKEGKRRQGWRRDLNGPVNQKPFETASILADMAGVSTETLRQVKYIAERGDQETIRRVRKGEISIYRAYCSLREKPLRPPEESVRPKKVEFQPIKQAVDDLIVRVSEGEASPRSIISELHRVSDMLTLLS